MSSEQRLQFCTLGMFIIDEIEYIDGKSRAQSVIGGAGTYAALGARLVAGAEHSLVVGWIVDEGFDFPQDFRTVIDSWRTSCKYRFDTTRLTTRAWNGYGQNEHRAFRYLTSKIRLDKNSLSDDQILASSFHMVCSPQRCISLVAGILARRRTLLKGEPTSWDRPRFIWEPVPDLCTPNELDELRKAVSYVDVVSPNAEELAAFFVVNGTVHSQQELAQQIVSWSIGHEGKGALVVREGSHGCSLYARAGQFHLPAYFSTTQAAMVVDPTGGGNAFLGALAMALGAAASSSSSTLAGYLEDADLISHMDKHDLRIMVPPVILATVSASFAIQQTGMPLLTHEGSSSELWNGEKFKDRVSSYTKRERQVISSILQVM